MVGPWKNSSVPFWLEVLLKERFFQPCETHEGARKNERNVFCLDCCCGFCPQCLSPHRSHRLLQIRRYVYQDVVRLDDLEKLVDCGLVQAYTTNSAKVLFLNERPQTRPFRASGHVCITCDRPLQESYLFCSLCCKVKHLLATEGSITRYLRECNFLPLSSTCDLDDGQLSPDSTLELAVGSTGINDGSEVEFGRSVTGDVGTSSDSVAEGGLRRSSCSSESVNRRKGAPSRSPLY